MVTAALVLAACGSSSSTKTTTPTTGTATTATSGAPTTGATDTSPATAAASTSGTGGGGLQASIDATTAAEKGSFRDVDPTPRPAAKNKTVVVISSGQASEASKTPSDAAVAAAKAIGWNVTLYDAKLNPANFTPLINQAVASGANGIILDNIDCDFAKQAMVAARAKGVALQGLLALDCTDPLSGGAPTGEFSGVVSYGPIGNEAAFEIQQGKDNGNYIVAASHNTAKVIDVVDDEFAGLKHVDDGMTGVLAASGGSSVVDRVKVTASDLATGKMGAIIQAALLRDSTATWIKSPYSAATLAAIVPDLGANPKHIMLMASQGSGAELDLIRKGVAVSADASSSAWIGWAAVDSLNSVFIGQKPVDSGVGLIMVDKTHNLPATGDFQPSQDYMWEYKKAWGIS